jgi:hypothetical protein
LTFVVAAGSWLLRTGVSLWPLKWLVSVGLSVMTLLPKEETEQGWCIGEATFYIVDG